MVALAWIHLSAENYELALSDHQMILELLELDVDEAARVDQTVAWLLCRLERCDEADLHVRRALASSEPIVRLRALANLAELELVSGQIDDCLARLDGIVTEHARLDADARDSSLAAEVDWLRGRALLVTGELEAAAEHTAAALASEALPSSAQTNQARSTLATIEESRH